MKAWAYGIGVSVVLASAVVLWYERPAPSAPLNPSKIVGNPTSSTQAQQPAPAVETGGRADLRSQATQRAPIKQQHASAVDYFRFAQSLLPLATAGDPDAQYYLYRTLERCDQENKLYFQRRGQKLALDQAIQYAAQRQLPVDTVQSVYDRCHQFQENDSTGLGSATEWLRKATDSAQPLAQATTASQILVQEAQQRLARAGGVPNPSPQTQIGNPADPQELFRQAVKSKDPEVIFAIGDAQNLLSPPNTDTTATRYAWWLVACERGLDCSGTSDWVRNMCAGVPQCLSASSASDLVRVLAGDKWPEVQSQAQEIESKINSGNWGDLHLNVSSGQLVSK
jgi:hypothetical protein